MMDSISSPQEDPKPSAEVFSTPPVAVEAGPHCRKPDDVPVREGPRGASSVVNSATGPRTTRGKNHSKKNATKHGIFSSAVVVHGESRADYESLLSGLRESFQPVGSLEEILVEKLATVLWRHCRMINAERAEIQNNLEVLEAGKPVVQRVKRIIRLSVDRDDEEGLISFIEDPGSLDRCLELFRMWREELQAAGEPLSESREALILKKIYGGSATAQDREERRKRVHDAPQELKEDALRLIDSEIRRLTKHKEKQTRIEVRRIDAEKVRQSIPDSPALERLMRYEATLERAFDRTLSQLERAQRLRMGQVVPPPIKLELSS